MGVIVTQRDEEEQTWLIDGQQRMTTCYLTIMAVAKLLLEYSAVEAAAKLVRRYLIRDLGEGGDLGDGHNEPTLIPSIDDRRDFQEVLSKLVREINATARQCNVKSHGLPDEVNNQRWPAPPGTQNHSRIGIRFNDIRRKIREREFSDPETRGKKITIKDAGSDEVVRFLGEFLAALLHGIELANFRVSPGQNAFSVFQKLNDTGMDLTLTDLVRSEIFIRERDVERAVSFREGKFREFEESMAIVADIPREHAEYKNRKTKNRESNLDSLYSGISVIATGGQAKRADAFSAIQGYFQNESCQTPRDCLGLISKWSPYYRVIQRANETAAPERIEQLPDEVLAQTRLMALNSIPSPIRPMIAVLLHKTTTGDVGSDDCLKCLRFLDSFLVRGACLSRGNAGLQGAFHPLVDSWNYGTTKEFKIGDVDGLKERLLHNQNLSIKNLGNEEVRSSPTFKQIPQAIAKYILYRLDRDIRETDMAQPHYFLECEVEHVYPQKPVKAWKDSIPNENHERLLHDFGNLTLLTPPANKKVLNEVYDAKKDHYTKAEQRFVITSEIPEEWVRWDEGAIEGRRTMLIDRVLEFWKPPLDI